MNPRALVRDQARARSATLPRAPSQPRGEIALRAAMLDALGEAVLAVDRDGRIIYWNAAAETFYGWNAADAIGADVVELLAGDGMRGDALRIMRRLRGGDPWIGECFVRHRDGHTFPIHLTATPVFDDGRLIAAVGVARDLSGQREAEQALAESEERLELVHRAAAAVIWEWDLRAQQVRWNEAIGNSFGYAAADVEETVEWWESRIHPDDRDRVTSGLWTALSEGRRFWTDEYRFLAGDGRYATVFDRAYVAMDRQGRPARVVGTMLDLTDRRRAHESARFLSQASMLLDLSLDYESTLPAIARLAASSVADACLLVLGSPGAVEHVVGVTSDPAVQETVDRVCARLGVGGLGDTLVQRVLASGESVVLPDVSPDLLASLDLDEDVRSAARQLGLSGGVVAPISARGKPLGAVLLARSRKSPRPGEDDVQLAEELGRRLGLAVENARLFHSAEVAQRAKADFLSVVSHELRTPLTAVLGYAELLSAEIAGTLNEGQKRQVSRIRAGGDRLLRVIEGILAYARLETGRERVQLERVPLASVLDRVRDIVAPQAAENAVAFREDLSAAPAEICADAGKLVQMLIALLTNAVKFSDGGVVGLRVSAAGENLLFDVSDSGPGLAVEHVSQVFNPFWQAEQPEVRRAGGAGLGLSVARRLARLMGGDLSVLNTSSDGTTFRLALPVLRD